MTTDIDCRKCFVKVVFCGRMGKRVGLRVFERKREGKVNRESKDNSFTLSNSFTTLYQVVLV